MTTRKSPKAKPKPKAGPQKSAGADPDDTYDASKPLANARHERFCQLLTMQGMSQTKAYILAGYGSTEEAARRSASVLMSKPDVASRFRFLQAYAGALVIDASKLSRTDVLNMIAEQHQRNIGVRPVTMSVTPKSGPNKGKTAEITVIDYDGRAASQTVKMMGEAFGIFDGSFGRQGAQDDALVRAGLDDGFLIEGRARLEGARRLALVGGTDAKRAEPSAAQAMATVKKLAGGGK